MVDFVFYFVYLVEIWGLFKYFGVVEVRDVLIFVVVWWRFDEWSELEG